ncbi:MAG: hypothetical protein EHM72_02955 [Calditrichaeota bacterium]|nr:MAG: hypothetical protein EHM72_02955 [Calditrichota bacterium]
MKYRVLNQNILFGMLLVVFMWHIGRFVNDFYVPESDFFDFRAKAMALRNGEWPEDFKRPPLYALILAPISSLFQGVQRELHAAEALNVVAAVVSFWLIYAIGRHLFPRFALVFLWAWAFHPSTVRMVVKPKSEIMVTVFILASIYFFLKEKRWAYFTAFLASMVRYEGALVIAAIGLADFIYRPRKIRTLATAFSAGIFIVLWTVLQSNGGDGGSYFSYFNEYKPNLQFFKFFWQGLLGFFPPQTFKLFFGCSFALFVYGMIVHYRKEARQAVAFMILFAGFILMHVVWPMPNFDYQVIIAWNVLIFIIFGAMGAGKYVYQHDAEVRRWLAKPGYLVISFALFILVTALLMFKPVSFPQYRVEWSTFLILFASIAIVLWSLLRVEEQPPVIFMMCAVFFMSITYWMSSATNGQQYDFRYSKAEFRMVAEWFAAHYEPGDQMVAEQPTIISFYSAIAEDAFIKPTELPDLDPPALHEWLKNRHVTYIAWMSANRIFATDNAWFQWKMDNRGWKIIHFLGNGQSQPGFQLLQEITVGPRKAYIYKITSE